MAIIFFGTPLFAVPALEKLISSGEDVVLVVTQPDRVGGRGHRIIPPPVKNVAEREGLTVAQPGSIRSEDFINRLKAQNPEFIVVVAYGRYTSKGFTSDSPEGLYQSPCLIIARTQGSSPDPVGYYQWRQKDRHYNNADG